MFYGFVFLSLWKNHSTIKSSYMKKIIFLAALAAIYVGYRYFSSFAYSKPSVKMTADGLTAAVTVTNTGSVPGKEVVQLYVSAPSGGLAYMTRHFSEQMP